MYPYHPRHGHYRHRHEQAEGAEELVVRLAEKLGAPVIIVDLLALTYRYLFVLVDEAMRLRRAAAGADLSAGGNTKQQ